MRRLLLSSLVFVPLTAAAQAGPEERLKTLEERLAKLESAPALSSLSAFNPAMGMALDGTFRQTHDKGNFALRAAELNFEAPVDPYLKAWVILNANDGGVGLEEATLETTSLPYSLTVRGGRLFASFGRMGHFHDHELPVIDRPTSLDTFVGGETQADGVEVSYLLPTGFFANATLGMYNKLGAENTDRAANSTPRTLNNFTYLGRLAATLELGDDHQVDFGLSSAWTPKRTVIENMATTTSGNVVGEVTKKNTWRTLTGVDMTYRWQPASGGLYKGLLWGTEVLQNDDRRFGRNVDDDRLPKDRVRSYAGYTFVQLKVGARWRPVLMYDVTQSLDAARSNTNTLTAALTYDLTEFQRLRAAYSRVDDSRPGNRHNDVVGLQWTAVLGKHVHGFRDR
ncbi:MAG: hypothetical protein FD126_1608 [Elusimicrobia bacterium]|nr:MAG: hypothetical protein FD126_1608 [Elusimicrobiota bacterium]